MAQTTILLTLIAMLATGVLGAAAKGHQDPAAAGGSENSDQATNLGGVQARFLDKCSFSKPTLILISGIGGSQMNGVSAGTPECPPLDNNTVVWYADQWFWGRALKCWSQHMSLQYDAATGRYTNSFGTQIWPDYGPVFGALPEGSKQKMFYTLLLRHLAGKHGYIPGKNFFIIPFDWRIGIQGLEQTGGLQRITEDISRGVAMNCGKKAIVMSHSYGANVMATIFQKPEFEQWRRDTISGWVPVGGPFGGCAATPWLTMLSGDFFKLFPLMSNLLKPSTTGNWQPTVVGKSVYNFAFGLPSWGWMLPREGVLGVNQTVIVTPSKNYTALEQKQLLLDMGDDVGAALLDDSWARSEKILEHGPIPDVETYCLYSTGVVTPVTLVFNDTIPKRQAVARPKDIIWTTGDGVVDLNSLRMCNRLAPADHLVEVNGPLVDHASILAHPAGLSALDNILYKLGVPREGPISRFVRNMAQP